MYVCIKMVYNFILSNHIIPFSFLIIWPFDFSVPSRNIFFGAHNVHIIKIKWQCVFGYNTKHYVFYVRWKINRLKRVKRKLYLLCNPILSYVVLCYVCVFINRIFNFFHFDIGLSNDLSQ
jgi:hypothetical protein